MHILTGKQNAAAVIPAACERWSRSYGAIVVAGYGVMVAA
jgi:hypothetical protein